LIYAHNLDAGAKRKIAKAVLHRLWSERTDVLSVQVLQEFYVNVTRKIPVPPSKHLAHLVVDIYSIWCIETTSAKISAASRIEDESQIAFCDALIVSSALKSGASRILSGGFSTGQRIAGVLIENPFASAH
jgi:predicted nucleic acid-binding protein